MNLFSFILVILLLSPALVASLQISKELSNFWQSIDRIAHHSNKHYQSIGERIGQFAAQFNRTESSCYRAIEKAFSSGLSEEWSAKTPSNLVPKVIQSNSFIQTNLLTNLMSEQANSLGDFDSCISSTSSSHVGFSSKYCLVALSTPQLEFDSKQSEIVSFKNNVSDYFHAIAGNWLQIRNRFPVLAGICVPAVCREAELKRLLEKYFEDYLTGIHLTVDYCQIQNGGGARDPRSSGRFAHLLARVALTSIILFALYSTLIHPFQSDQHTHGPFHNLCNCFHLVDNLRRLFHVTETPETEKSVDIRFVHGIKSLLVVQMLFIHVFFNFSILFIMKISYFGKFPAFYNGVFDQDSAADEFALQIDVVPVWISAFFIMSGFLSAYVILTRCPSRPPPFWLYLLYRYLNLLPLVLATLALTILFQHLGSGPLFHERLTDTYVKPCRVYWWTHVLLINNFWNVDQMCGPNLWFIAANFQLYLLLFPLLILYYYRKSLGYLFGIVLAVLNFLYLLVLVYFNNIGLPSTYYPMRFNFPVPYDSMRLLYTSPVIHMFSYFMGVLAALYLVDNRDKLKSITTTFYHIATILTFTTIFLLTYLPLTAHFKSPGNEVKSLPYALILTAILILFVGISTGWFLLTVLVRGSPLKRFLELPAFVIISRLTYGLYFLNAIPIWFNASTSRETPKLSWRYLVNTSFLNVFQTFALAVLMYLFIEAPFKRVNWLIFSKFKK